MLWEYRKPNLDGGFWFPSVNQVYSIVNQEEAHKGATVGVHDKQESEAFHTQRNSGKNHQWIPERKTSNVTTVI